MGNARFSDEFKRDAVRQITERGYPVAEVSQRLGVSQHSLYEWRKKFSKPVTGSGEDDQAAEVRRLKRELARVTEERDPRKKRPRTSPRMQSDPKGRAQQRIALSWPSIARSFRSVPCAAASRSSQAGSMPG